MSCWLLLTMKIYFTIAVWRYVRLPTSAPVSERMWLAMTRRVGVRTESHEAHSERLLRL
jgi:hypothetical protein